MTVAPHTEVIRRIFDECASPLGFAMRGVASWEYDRLLELRELPQLTTGERAELEHIAFRVFGGSHGIADRNKGVRDMEYKWKRHLGGEE